MSVSLSTSAAFVGPAVIELGGTAGTLLLLAPLVVLLAVVAYVARRAPSAPPPAPPPAPPEAAERAAEPISPTVAARAAAGGPVAETLAAQHLSLARGEIAAGRQAAAADHLRSCIRAAAESRDGAAQAEARLELAEIARAAGDLTTACEHWQIARALFHELSEKPALESTEVLMRRHGCPTDWVLNDF